MPALSEEERARLADPVGTMDEPALELVEIQLADCHPHDKNPRGKVTPDAAMTKSISDVGILTPPTVAPNGDGFVILAGHRRIANGIKAGLEATRMFVKTGLTEQQVIEHLVVENLAREDLSITEEAFGVALMFEVGMNQAKIARALSRSTKWVKARVELAGLPKEVRQLVENEQLYLEDIEGVGALYTEEPEAVIQWAKDALAKKWGVTHHSLLTAVNNAKSFRALKEITDKLDAAGEKYWTERDKVQGAIVAGTKVETWELPHAIPVLRSDEGRAHRKEPCHANYLAPTNKGVKRYEVCTDPKRHTKTGESTIKATKKAGESAAAGSPGAADTTRAEKVRAFNKAEKEDNTRALVAMNNLCVANGTNDINTWVEDVWFDSLGMDAMKGTALALGIEPIITTSKTYDNKVRKEKDWTGAVRQAWKDAGTSKVKRARILRAAAIGEALKWRDIRAKDGANKGLTDRLRKLLVTAGYEPVRMPAKP